MKQFKRFSIAQFGFFKLLAMLQYQIAILRDFVVFQFVHCNSVLPLSAFKITMVSYCFNFSVFRPLVNLILVV